MKLCDLHLFQSVVLPEDGPPCHASREGRVVPESGFVIDLDGLESDYDLQQMVGREEPEGKEGVGIEGSEVVRMEGRKGTEGTEIDAVREVSRLWA